MASSSSTDAATSSVVERVQNFVSENKKAILLTAVAAAIGAAGVAYYASTSRPRPPLGDVEKGDGSDASSSSGKKKKSKSGKKKKARRMTVGPFWRRGSPRNCWIACLRVSDDLDLELDAEELAALPEETRTKYAAAFKGKGNTAYTKRNFSEAADYYTKAINVTPKPEPVFYSNRAACYVNFNPPDHEKVVADCDEALKLDPNYVKALNRRAVGLEGLNRLEEALRDYTAATILDKFQNAATANAVERPPNKTSFAHLHLSLLCCIPTPPRTVLPVNPSQGDETLQMALGALAAANYPHALSLVNEAITQGISWDAGKAEAFTCAAPSNRHQHRPLVHPGPCQDCIRAHGAGRPGQGVRVLRRAIKQNANDPDIYYHRGQVLFIMSEFSQAAENYLKSTELDDVGRDGREHEDVQAPLTAFPQRSEPQNYYGELLLDQGRFQEAVEKFERAIEIEKTKPSPNVLALVNKGLALFQWKQDVGCRPSTEQDQERDGDFKKQAEIARTEPELINALTYQYATASQLEFLKNYPNMAAQLNALARGM
ncbi:hypothetical protein D9611_015035 [Ephemerocybe angulata]|uniref:Uncharacterized protein n=1 Tax=Ephemerocybe angulata TaxID=980116 RepID=A0A8H5AQ35_9AGAR|nr:hypothetical protein D9611_015035 [Tulosesus angulatus]